MPKLIFLLSYRFGRNYRPLAFSKSARSWMSFVPRIPSWLTAENVAMGINLAKRLRSEL